MNKLLLLLMAAMLFCSACSGIATPPQTNGDATPPTTQTSSPTNELTTASLTSDEARAIAQKWLDDHPDIQFSAAYPNVLEHNHRNMVVDGKEYYLFHLDNAEIYWFSILVHTETGTLLHRLMSDGEFPVEEIEPLDDWYNKYYLEI